MLRNNVQHIKKRSEGAYVKRDNVLLWNETLRLNSNQFIDLSNSINKEEVLLSILTQ